MVKTNLSEKLTMTLNWLQQKKSNTYGKDGICQRNIGIVCNYT